MWVRVLSKEQTDYLEYSRSGSIVKMPNTDIPENTPIMYNGKVVGHTTGKNSINRPVKGILYPDTLPNELMSVQDTVSIDACEVVSLEIKND